MIDFVCGYVDALYPPLSCPARANHSTTYQTNPTSNPTSNPTPNPTQHKQVPDFVARTGVDLLACTIGNVHGNYAVQPPQLDLPRLEVIRGATDRCVACMYICCLDPHGLL